MGKKKDIKWKNQSPAFSLGKFLFYGAIIAVVVALIIHYIEPILTFITVCSVALLVGWTGGKMWKRRNFKKAAERFNLPFPVTNGSSIIASRPSVEKRKNLFFYKFSCKINPNKALMADGSVVPMKVPDEYKIKEFIVGVDKNNIVHWVHLGDEQYHCDKHMPSNCFNLQHLYKVELTYEFLHELITLLETYSQDTPMNIDHWHNKSFERLNFTLVRALEAV